MDTEPGDGKEQGLRRSQKLFIGGIRVRRGHEESLPSPATQTASKEAVSLHVLGSSSNAELSTGAASDAFGSVSNILHAAQSSADTSPEEQKKHQEKVSSQLRNVAQSILDSLHVTKPNKYGEEQVFEVSTPLIKAKKTRAKPNSPLSLSLEGVKVGEHS